MIRDTTERFPDISTDAGETDPDTLLVKRTLAGDVNAFELLVRRYQTSLFRTARWMGLSPDVAEDMVQDTFLKAYTQLRNCRNPDRFGFWVRRILRNTCLDYLKSAARRIVPLSLSLPSADVPDEEQERNVLHSRLSKALFTLPEEQREAFLMKHVEELSYEEMAELTGSSLSALKMRVHRAREVLRARMNSFLFHS
jgi:RNA polymerase sigma-70 factor, ECF subfamily